MMTESRVAFTSFCAALIVAVVGSPISHSDEPAGATVALVSPSVSTTENGYHPNVVASLREFLELLEKRPDLACRVDIEVSLVFAAPHWSNIFVQDGDQAVMVSCSDAAASVLANLSPGARLRIRGDCFPHEWRIRLSTFDILKSSGEMTPLVVKNLEQEDPLPLNGLMEVEARVEEILVAPDCHSLFSWVNGVPICIQLFDHSSEQSPLSLLDRNVVANGCVTPQHHPGQSPPYILRAMKNDQIRLANGRQVDWTRVDNAPNRKFNVYSGEILYTDNQTFFILGTLGGIRVVETRFAATLTPGTRISLQERRPGAESGSGAGIRSSAITVLSSGPLSHGTPTDINSLMFRNAGLFRATLTGIVKDRRMLAGFGELTLVSQGTEFFARIPASSTDVLSLRIGDQVRVTGAPLVAAHGSSANHASSRVTLYSASPADLEFLGAAAQSNSYITTCILAVLTILGAVMVWNWSLRRQVQSRTTQLNEASTHLRTAFDAVREAVLVNDRNCRVTGFNREFVRLFGFQPIEGQIVTAALRTIELQLVDRNIFAALQLSAFEGGDRSATAVLELRSPGLTLHAFSSPIVDASGICHGNLWTFEDVTEKLRFESELLQAQKMDAIGQLSGGIAHDFNNLLTIIRSSITLIDLSISSGQSWHEYTNAAETAVDRAAELTQHLLDFSRKSRLDLRLIEVNPFIERVLMLVRRSMDCTVELKVRLLEEPANITVDVTRLEQVLINLCINARDALPEKGGEIRLELSKRSNHRLGNVVVIAVEDNGIGMSAELCQRIFEPFFTTKKPGHGTGLGLAMAHGVVEQLGGSIACDSELGRGTRFEIVLPASDASVVTNIVEPLLVQKAPCPLRVLLVDDEVLVRESGQAILESLGHSTLTAANGREALDMLLSGNEFDLIMLDLTMPEMSGKETFFEIRSRWPSLPVAICSGYSLDTQLWLTDDVENPPTVIPKPYRRKDLDLHLQSLQKTLASPKERASLRTQAASE